MIRGEIMLKKFVWLSTVFTTLFSFCNELVYAYEYYDAENEDNVLQMIGEIYDAEQQYIDLAGEKKEDGMICTNGMSVFKRNGENGNSDLLD